MKLRILPTVVALIGVPLTFSLGVWQVQRHQQKMSAHEIVSERIQATPVDHTALATPDESDHWKLIRITGSYVDQTALIGGQMVQNQPGYNLLQLFQTDSGHSVIVERGWMPREDIGDHYNTAMSNNNNVTIEGQLRPIRFHFEMQPIQADDFPTYVWRPGSQGEIHRRWLPDEAQHYMVLGPVLREHQSKNLETMPYSGFVPTPAEYNSFFYAIQWFLISVILFAIWFAMGIVRNKEENASQ